ncbi:NusG domain II-containing protein [uncultured Eubacterium sp.]|uniref:NusG domain II-containing protein n=1 Tax=uncultured Eubacterium sp. TaxID=165185 RepID=UPI00259932FE|nr:NusG domain II-containing protein [uncultured Eubacterium sp.]
MSKKETNKFLNNKIEKVLWIIILGVAVALFLFLKFSANDGEQVIVKVDKKEIARYDLNTDREVIIDGKDGGKNTLVIKDGKAYIKDATCPDKLCEHQGKIHMVGQSLICLPNRVIIEITDDKKDEEFDGISK